MNNIKAILYTITFIIIFGNLGGFANPLFAQVIIADAGPDQVLTCADSQITLGSENSSDGPSVIYQWTSNSFSPILEADQKFAFVSHPDIYYLAITDTINNFESMDTVIVTEDIIIPHFFIEQYQDLSCENDTITLQAFVLDVEMVDLQYQWSTSNGNIVSIDTVASIQVDAEGSYELKVTNKINGCEAIETALVFEITPSALVLASFHCQIDTITIGELPFMGANFNPELLYSWTTANGNILGSSNEYLIDILEPGLYERISLNPTTNCEQSFYFEIIILNLEANAGPDQIVNCDMNDTVILGDSLTTSASSVFYSWSFNNSFFSSNKFIEVSDPGLYVLKVTDIENECVRTDSVHVVSDGEIEEVSIEITEGAIDPCGRFTTFLSAANLSAFPAYEFNWILPNGEGSTETEITADLEGNYFLSYTNTESGCSAVDIYNYVVDTEGVLNVILETQNISCFGEDDGSVKVSIEGGVEPYTLVSESATNQNLAPGLYSLTVTDNVGCERVEEVEIVEPEPLLINFGLTVEGFYIAEVTGGTGEYSFVWNTSVSTPFIENPIEGTTYTVEVTDTNGCTAMAEGLYSLLSTDAQYITSIHCFPNPNKGTFTIDQENLDLQTIQIYNLQGKTIPYTIISQSSSQTTLRLDGNTKGAYFLKLETAGKIAMKKIIVL